MTVSRHLGLYQSASGATRSAGLESPGLETNMEWIGCTVCKIFAFLLYCDLETGVRVIQGRYLYRSKALYQLSISDQ